MSGPVTLVVLLLAAVATSCITAIVGLLGGIILLATMMGLLLGSIPYVAIIFVHGVGQLWSNAFRTWVFREHVDARAFVAHSTGVVLAAPFGYLLLREALKGSERTLMVLFGAFVLLMTWMPPARMLRRWIARGVEAPEADNALPAYARPGVLHLWPLFVSGGLVGGLTFFFGATGPLITPFFRRMGYVKEGLIANQAAVQATSHAAKVVLLSGLLGVAGPRVAIGDYGALLAVLIPGVSLGTILGKRLQGRLSTEHWSILLRWALTIAAVYLLYRGLVAGA